MPVTRIGPTCDHCNVRAVWKIEEDGKEWCARCWYLWKAFR